MKGYVSEGRCGLAGIGLHTSHQGVSGYLEQNIGMLVWLGKNVLGYPKGILFVVGCDGGGGEWSRCSVVMDHFQ